MKNTMTFISLQHYKGFMATPTGIEPVPADRHSARLTIIV